MSAYIVDKELIDILVEAASRPGPAYYSPGMSWWDCDLVTLRRDGSWQEHQREMGYSDRRRAAEVGQMLWAENLASIEERYPDTAENGHYPGPRDFTREDVLLYTYEHPRPERTPLQVLVAIACYEYQTCEHPAWPSSEAASFCDALRHKMIRSLPGYSDAHWEAEEPA